MKPLYTVQFVTFFRGKILPKFLIKTTRFYYDAKIWQGNHGNLFFSRFWQGEQNSSINTELTLETTTNLFNVQIVYESIMHTLQHLSLFQLFMQIRYFQ